MRVAVLWTGLSGYLNACLKALGEREGVELFVSHKTAEGDAPFADQQFSWIARRMIWRSTPDANLLGRELEAFRPEITVMASWHIPAYRSVARRDGGKSWRVLIMDNPWYGTLRQRFGVLAAPYYVKPLADAVWLPGERQSMFARRLGFKPSDILWGSFSCDQPRFASVYRERIARKAPLPRAFLYVGRYLPLKGIRTMVEAYGKYYSSCSSPWPLICCGAGALQPLLEGKPGIQLVGFQQPEEMASVYAKAGCLLLPSNSEHWSLVVHEATSAGLGVLASEKVGAVVHLVQPGANGFVFARNDANELAAYMARISQKSDRALESISECSNLLSRQYSPQRWADTLIEEFSARKNLVQRSRQSVGATDSRSVSAT